MKERELPSSFWQPPTTAERSTMENCFKSDANDPFETRTDRISITSPPDTNLLFSLFKILEQSRLKPQSKNSLTAIEPPPSSEIHYQRHHNQHKTSSTSDRMRHHQEESTSYSASKQDETVNMHDVEDVDEKEPLNSSQPLLKIMEDDDPYLSLKHDPHNSAASSVLFMPRRTNESSYSDLLSDLVVNL